MSLSCFLDLVDFRVGIPSVRHISSPSSWAISALSLSLCGGCGITFIQCQKHSFLIPLLFNPDSPLFYIFAWNWILENSLWHNSRVLGARFGKMEWQKVLEEPEIVVPLDRVTLLELHEKEWTWFSCQSLRCETVFDWRKFSFFCYDARHIEGFSIFAPLTDLNVVLPAGKWQSIPLKDWKVKHLSVNSFILIMQDKEVAIYKPFVLGITHKDSSIRKMRFLHMSMNGDFWAELLDIQSF